MPRPLTAAAIAPPLARYSHAVEVAAGEKLVVCSGQLGMGDDGQVPPSVAGQAERCFENVRAILAAGGLGMEHVVRISAFVTSRDDLADYMAVRDRYIADPPPASTLMIVSGFSRPEFLVEVEVIAAGPA